ncbi:hypothetical protein KOR34_17620 [Posidoniimonas corsicana]|uniref:PEP-CTERM protein-sorting domain-containing protein n=1 Tax=Posidoniimonas corsicana TaxID=1938618 RepID=A0A5C5VFT8_9BACT|nr:DUF4331 family protein [Posidoniimonas corsicana]TWT36817.1 hypothetical protein KOR34_17620 [Posidoniimonas corsicana]
MLKLPITTLAALAMCAAAGRLDAADHLDAPSLSGAGQVDINDLYAFQSPANPSNSVLVMTVNPLSGVLSPRTFDPSVAYEFAIDYDGDAVEDLTYSASFAPAAGGVQAYTVTRSAGGAYAGVTGGSTTVGGVQVSAGQYDDPFFFDLNGFNETLDGTGGFTGEDFFAGADVSAIVLEVPSADLINPTTMDSNIAVWARTVDSGGMQLDRIGRPAINTVLISGDARKEAFNAGAPMDDPSEFGAEVQARIEALNGGDTATAMSLTGVLLPDVLTFDTASADGFLNGRGLADDVIDAELGLLTNNAITTDMVDGNDAAFLNVFPYLAPANVPEPAAATLLLMATLGMLQRRRR